MKFSAAILTLALASLVAAVPAPHGWTPSPPQPPSLPRPSWTPQPPNPPKPPISQCKKKSWNVGCCKQVKPCQDNGVLALLGLLRVKPTSAQEKEKVGMGCDAWKTGKCGGGTIPVCFETKINGGIGLGAYEIDYDD